MNKKCQFLVVFIVKIIYACVYVCVCIYAYNFLSFGQAIFNNELCNCNTENFIYKPKIMNWLCDGTTVDIECTVKGQS